MLDAVASAAVWTRGRHRATVGRRGARLAPGARLVLIRAGPSHLTIRSVAVGALARAAHQGASSLPANRDRSVDGERDHDERDTPAEEAERAPAEWEVVRYPRGTASAQRSERPRRTYRRRGRAPALACHQSERSRNRGAKLFERVAKATGLIARRRRGRGFAESDSRNRQMTVRTVFAHVDRQPPTARRPPSWERRLIRRASSGDAIARRAVRGMYEPMVRRIACTLYLPQVETATTWHGTQRVGVIDAARAWDPSRGVPFSCFARLCATPRGSAWRSARRAPTSIRS